MIEPDPEKVQKRYRSFFALYEQMGGRVYIYDFVKSVAESYEWMRAERDFWKNESIESIRELRKCQTLDK